MKKPARETVYEYIYGKILCGSLPLGARLTEVGIATELGVSRTPVREALARLVHEGLAVNVPGEGIFLRESNRHDLEELFQMRTIFEVFAIREAATKLTPSLRERLTDSVDVLRQIAVEIRDGSTRTNEERWRDVCQAELNFHLSIIKATGNDRLLRCYSDTVLLVQTICCFEIASMLTYSEAVHNYYQHRRILAIMRSGNVDKAEKAIRKHLQLGLGEALKQYDANHPDPQKPEPASVWMEVLR
ncbi:MAG: GntR family transcriptional regulator [Planctomycetia bacterium]|nr:GntR family transcriptional regulator [Planctomycetia bacterium]